MAILLYATLALVAAFVPLALAEWSPRFVSMSYGRRTLPFELLGLTGGALILYAGWREWRRRASLGAAALAEVAVPLLLALHFLVMTSEYAERRFDYDCYEYAGRALLAGANPYQVGLIYLYPPLTAKAMAAAYQALEWVSTAFGWSAARDDVWDRVFYLYQCAQLGLVVGAYFLLLRFARVLGLASAWTPVLVGALLVFDNAVFRTLRHGQVNLWVLDLSLVALLAASRVPALSGLALALAGHVKLYPLIVGLPMALRWRWRALVWSAVWLAAIGVGLADFGRDFAIWRWFGDFASQSFPGEIAIRNASPHAIAYNATRLLFGTPRFVTPLALAGAAGFAAWFLARAWTRERAVRATLAPAGGALEARAFAVHGADALAFSLLVSPSVWEHHYVLALPLALWAIALRLRERPGLVALGVFLMLGMPTFDLFPLSLHRLAGMLILLGLTPSRRLDLAQPSEIVRHGD